MYVMIQNAHGSSGWSSRREPAAEVGAGAEQQELVEEQHQEFEKEQYKEREQEQRKEETQGCTTELCLQ